jgi:hypothetical protein
MREFLQRTEASKKSSSVVVSGPQPTSRLVARRDVRLLQLQRSIGNRAVQRLLSSGSILVVQREPAPTPAQAPAQTPDQTHSQSAWGAKKWPPFENDWNSFYQLAVQGLAGGKLKPEKIPDLAAKIADLSMAFCLKHGVQLKCAKDAAPNEDGKSAVDVALPWGDKGMWGQTFRSALQSTCAGVDGPDTANAAVEKAGIVADQAVRAMLGDDLWKIYMNCKTPGASSSAKQSPKK